MVEATSSWCVARSDASYQALQTALDYACWAGADCTPIQSDGLCFLPNTIQAHASYAFNSYYQRKGMAPGSCDFSGTANIARTDPSQSPFLLFSSPLSFYVYLSAYTCWVFLFSLLLRDRLWILRLSLFSQVCYACYD
ncbi:unnamed protein product [Linum tenue]|uniref:X8 domain-containing protein n=1 Tax=Linum tenue TaxID=586396 RepID=A0AAV0H5F1_9ROSI|nr:unnamed protein product [Linum tenue]